MEANSHVHIHRCFQIRAGFGKYIACIDDDMISIGVRNGFAFRLVGKCGIHSPPSLDDHCRRIGGKSDEILTLEESLRG